MTLLLQTDSGLNVENAIIEDVFSSLGKSFLWATTTLERITMEDLKTKEYDKNSVPIGSIEFIEFWLKKYHNKKSSPICSSRTLLCIMGSLINKRIYRWN